MQNKDEITIREAKDSDLDDLCSMVRKLIEYHRERDSGYPKLKDNTTEVFRSHFNKQISSNDVYLVVAEHEGKAVGYAEFLLSKLPAFALYNTIVKLSDMFVDYEFRGNGIGYKLIDKGKKWAEEQNIKHIRLEVFLWNDVAIKAYESSGFKKYKHIMRHGW